jgi:hypothetical protein
MTKENATLEKILKNEKEEEFNIFICENTDGILDPLEQMTYALNELQVKYESVVILKNAP